MNKLVKRLSFWIGFTGLLCAAVAFSPALISLLHREPLTQADGLAAKVFADRQAEIIIGFLIFGLTGAVVIFLQQHEVLNELSDLKSTSENASDLANQKFMALLQINKEFYLDKWLFDRLGKLCEIKRRTQGRRIHLRRDLEKAIDLAFDRCTATYTLTFPRDQESARQIRLKMAVEDAVNYVYAVTYDADDYAEMFWAGEFQREYIRANAAASQRGVRVSRVFVVGEDIISGDDNNERKKILSKAIRDHIRRRISVTVVSKNNLPPGWAGHTRSFLVCDDCVASESYTPSSNQSLDDHGYVSYNDLDNIDKLKVLFQNLQFTSDEHTRRLAKRLS
jgi:hypothetical protein